MNQRTTWYAPQSSQLSQRLTPEMSLNQPYMKPQPSKTSLKNPENHFSWSIFQQSQQSPSTLEDPYSCNFIGQLAGSYEIDSHSCCDHVSVIVPEVSDIEQPYAIVRAVCNDGEALPDMFIWEEKVRFNLCSTDGKVVAVMPKGINMKHFIKWKKKDDSEVIWRRTGNVVFSLVTVDVSSCSRRDSICSVYSTASSTILNNSVCAAEIENVRNHIRPELRYLCNMQPVLTPQKTTLCQANPLNWGCSMEEMYHVKRNKHYPSTASIMPELERSEKLYQVQKNLETQEMGVKSEKVLPANVLRSMAQEEKLFQEIKAHCNMNPSLLKRVVRWGNSKSQSEQMTLQDHEAISEGRLWVAALTSTNLSPNESDEKLQEAVEDIKGAYQKVSDGVWQQPTPSLGEPGLQHRLRKDSSGSWVIEEQIKGKNNEKSWNICVKELSDHRWVDMKNDHREIKVKKLQMDTILERMMQDKTLSDSAHAQKKYVDFLFKSCNQRKLNSKLKKRNLKHNIANLKAKLDKQYALSFAIQVAKTADVIAQELDVMTND